MNLVVDDEDVGEGIDEDVDEETDEDDEEEEFEEDFALSDDSDPNFDQVSGQNTLMNDSGRGGRSTSFSVLEFQNFFTALSVLHAPGLLYLLLKVLCRSIMSVASRKEKLPLLNPSDR
ncbi:hypothetical protein Tco_1034419 [Tanacetum coccineum]